MKTYRINFNTETRNQILDIIIDFSGQILINDITGTSVGMTIEGNDPDELYRGLLEEIDEKIFYRRSSPYLLD